ncbi:MAG: hypothetical protein JXM71_11595 [Spirochaetales bacterium]|nr:hypothetical protein [Spirochaetales bacterium]
MSMKRFVVFAVVALVLTTTVLAAPVVVDFVDGDAHVLAGGSWKRLDFDDKLDSAQSVKLGAGAILELRSQAGSTVTIAAPGTYLVDSLFKPKTEASAVATVAGKLEKLAKGGKQDATVAGVRGSEAVVAKETMWAGGTIEADEAFAEADVAFKGGDHGSAWSLYMESLELYLEASDPTGAARAAYSASLAAIAGGSGAKALASLRAASAEDAGALRGSYALALATLSARYGATADAKALLNTAITAGWFDDPTSLADAKSLLSGL